MKFKKNYEEIKNYKNNLSHITMKEYYKQKPEIQYKITSTPLILSDINNIIQRITSSDIKNPKMKTEAYEKIKIVEKEIIEKNKELTNIFNEIIEKENSLFSKVNESYIS